MENLPMTSFYKAISEVAGTLQTVVKNAANPFNKSRYADIGQIVKAITPALTKHGLSVVHLVKSEDKEYYLESRLCHEEGFYLTSEIPLLLPAKQDMQALGAAITYARRYNCMALLNLAISDKSDDDGTSIIDDKIDESQINQLKSILNGDKTIRPKVLKFFGLSSFMELKKSQFDVCLDLIHKEKEKE